MELQYRWTKADLEAFCELQANKMLFDRRKGVLAGRIYFTACFLVLAAMINVHLIVLSIALLALAIMAAIYYPSFIKHRWIKQLQKAYSQNETLYQDRELIIGDDLITARTQGQETKLDRRSVKCFIQTESTFFLEFSNGMYVVIPKSAFRTVSNEREFVQMFSSS